MIRLLYNYTSLMQWYTSLILQLSYKDTSLILRLLYNDTSPIRLLYNDTSPIRLLHNDASLMLRIRDHRIISYATSLILLHLSFNGTYRIPLLSYNETSLIQWHISHTSLTQYHISHTSSRTQHYIFHTTSLIQWYISHTTSLIHWNISHTMKHLPYNDTSPIHLSHNITFLILHLTICV